MFRSIAAIVSLLALTFPLWAADVQVSMMYSNATKGAQPFVLFEGKEWRADENARFVKLHIYFDEEVELTGFDLVPCGTDRAIYKVYVFVNFDDLVFRSTSDADVEEPYLLYEWQARFAVMRVRSLTINFERNRSVRLCGMTLLDIDRKPHTVKAPRIVGGSVSASSTLRPTDAYAASNLFDSRFEYAWATDKLARGVSLDFSFAEPQTVSRLMVWNGYQRSPTHCQQNSRVHTLRIEADGGQVERVQLADVFGSQVVPLPRALRGSKFRLTVEEAYRGTAYQDLAISELRFGDEAGWFMLDASAHLQSMAEKHRRAFADAGVELLLNQGYTDADGMRVRLRADGSFYVSGRYRQKGGDKDYFTLGSYEVLPTDASGTLKLRLFGVYREEQVAYGDCNACGWDCNTKDAEGRLRGRIFQQRIVLNKRVDRTGFEMRAEGPARLRFKPTVLVTEVD